MLVKAFYVKKKTNSEKQVDVNRDYSVIDLLYL